MSLFAIALRKFTIADGGGLLGFLQRLGAARLGRENERAFGGADLPCPGVVRVGHDGVEVRHVSAGSGAQGNIVVAGFIDLTASKAPHRAVIHRLGVMNEAANAAAPDHDVGGGGAAHGSIPASIRSLTETSKSWAMTRTE